MVSGSSEPVIDPQAGTTQISKDVWETVATGELDHHENLNNENQSGKFLNALYAARLEKTSFPVLEGSAPDVLEQLKAKTESLKKEYQALIQNQKATVDLAVSRNLNDTQFKEELEKLSQEEIERIINAYEYDRELNEIQRQIEALEKEPRFMKVISVENKKTLINDVNKIRQETLRDTLKESLKGGLKADSEKPEGPEGPSGGFQEIDGVADHERIKQVTALESQITQLEKIVGMDESSHLGFPYANIPSALAQLTERVLWLDTRRVDIINDRAQKIVEELARVQDMSVKLVRSGFRPASQEERHKIEELYTLVSDWESFSCRLPKILKKLEYMNEAAIEAREFETRMSELEREVNAMRESTESTEQILNQLSTALTTRLQAIDTFLQKKSETRNS